MKTGMDEIHSFAPSSSSNRLVYQVQNSETLQHDTEETAPLPATIQYKGSFSIQQISFHFTHLLGIYVRKKLPLERVKMQDRRDRPATRAEKQYVRALAKAAREAPGNARDFDGFEGW